jgi:hypothetical protein
MFTVDKYLKKPFDIVNYNCWDFIRDVLIDLKGVDVDCRTPNPPTREAMRVAFATQENQFKRLGKPEDGCIVLFSRPKSTPHVGVFYKGKVLHLEKNGAHYQPLDIVKLGFKNIRYYECKPL